jgi:hypothetical protein
MKEKANRNLKEAKYRDRTPRQIVLAKQRAALESKERKRAAKLRLQKEAQEQEESSTSGALTESNVKSLVAATKPCMKQYWKKSNKAKWEGQQEKIDAADIIQMNHPNAIGNSNSLGSVDSGLLDENVCYECGLNTLQQANWNDLILCDICDGISFVDCCNIRSYCYGGLGEYHIGCVNRDSVPRAKFTCPRCAEELREFRNLRYMRKVDIT